MNRTKLEFVLLVLLILALLVIAFVYNQWKNSDNELQILKGSIKVEKNIDDINTTLEPMMDREINLYPDLYKKLENLKKQYVLIEYKHKKLKTNESIRKEKEKEYEKANLIDLSNELSQLGFTNTVVSGSNSKTK